MSLTVGFVIVSHNDPEQLTRLVDALNNLYGRPPIAVHHNFSITALDLGRFGDNVRFVQPNLATKWGHISVINAGLAALRVLYKHFSPDWFTLLSAADYPVMSGDEVVDEIRRTPVDVYLDWQVV